MANSFWNHVIQISSREMYFQDIYSNLWKVKIFSANIYSLKSNTYFWGTVMFVQDGFLYFIVTRHKLTVLIIPLGPFQIFSKIRGDICSSRFATGVNDTGGKWKKTFKQKNFNNFVWTPLDSRVNIYINVCLQVHFKVSAAWYCCHYLPPVSTTPVANLPLASLIPVAICQRRRWHRWQILRRYRWHRRQICHRYKQRKRKWWKNLPPLTIWLANISANFRKNSKRSKWNTLGLGRN